MDFNNEKNTTIKSTIKTKHRHDKMRNNAYPKNQRLISGIKNKQQNTNKIDFHHQQPPYYVRSVDLFSLTWSLTTGLTAFLNIFMLSEYLRLFWDHVTSEKVYSN